MKFAAQAFLLAAAVGAVAAQSSSAPAASSSEPAPPASSSSSTPAAGSGSGSGSGSGAEAAGATPTATCTLFSGDPRAQPFGCPENAVTSTPPYDSASLQSFLIGGYSVGREGEHFSEVAKDLAEKVTEAYPTLTEDFSQIYSQYLTAIQVSATNYVPPPNAAPATMRLPAGLTTFAALVAAVAAGGAFVL